MKIFKELFASVTAEKKTHSSRYLYPLSSQKQKILAGGVRKEANRSYFPSLQGLALYLLQLNPGGIREPHWHVNAHELLYCIQGKAVVTIFGPAAFHSSFEMERGEIAFIPKGYLHAIENRFNKEALFAVGFNHENPEEFNLSTIFGAVQPAIMAATFDVDPSLFNTTERQQAILIGKTDLMNPLQQISKTSPFKFKLNAIDPQIDVNGGTIALSHKENFAPLDGIALFDLRLKKGGVREPHWHPNAAELDVAISGQAKMLVMAPDGSKEVFDVKKGDVVFIPQAYYHYIENSGDEELHFAVYFNHESPQDVGISGSIGAFSTDLLTTILQMKEDALKPLTKNQADVFIAPRLMK